MATVTVACKLPHGFEMKVQEPYSMFEQVMGGGSREVTRYRDKGEPVFIRGVSVHEGVPIITHGGYALTQNVDEAFFNAWMAQWKDSAMVKNQLVFAMAKEESAQAKGRELKEVKSGMERLDPENLPGMKKNVQGIDKGLAVSLSLT